LIYLEKPNEKPNHYEPFLSITMGGRLYAEGELNLSSSRHYDTDERYQVYPRPYQDSRGNGVGDLAGIM
jgi:hypothetical protein